MQAKGFAVLLLQFNEFKSPRHVKWTHFLIAPSLSVSRPFMDLVGRVVKPKKGLANPLSIQAASCPIARRFMDFIMIIQCWDLIWVSQMFLFNGLGMWEELCNAAQATTRESIRRYTIMQAGTPSGNRMGEKIRESCPTKRVTQWRQHVKSLLENVNCCCCCSIFPDLERVGEIDTPKHVNCWEIMLWVGEGGCEENWWQTYAKFVTSSFLSQSLYES